MRTCVSFGQIVVVVDGIVVGECGEGFEILGAPDWSGEVTIQAEFVDLDEAVFACRPHIRAGADLEPIGRLDRADLEAAPGVILGGPIARHPSGRWPPIRGPPAAAWPESAQARPGASSGCHTPKAGRRRGAPSLSTPVEATGEALPGLLPLLSRPDRRAPHAIPGDGPSGLRSPTGFAGPW